MSNYTITTDFGAKDDLLSGNAAKVIKGSEFTAEFTNIKTAVNSKADSVSPTFTGNTALNGTTTFGPDGTSTFNGTVNFTKDVTFDTDTMFVDVSENKVGIGTANPTSKLHVLNTGTTAISDAIANSGAILDGGTGNIGLNMITPNTGACYINFGDSADSNAGRLIYNHNNNAMSFDTNAQERMRIDVSGNVGIGTTNPIGTLDIKTTGNVGFEFFPENTTDTNLIINYDRTSGTYQNLQTRAATHQFLIGTSEKMRIDSSGNVGIGTTNPEAKLEVDGAKNDNLLILEGAADNFEFHVTSGDAATANSSLYRLALERNGVDNGFIDFYRGNAGSDGYLTFGSSGTERMRIDASGNLLVGKTTNSVDVAGALIRADGKISACVEGDYAGIFHRKTSSGDDADGAIVHFRKDNVTVGSIGTNDSNYLYVGNGDTNLAFSAGSDLIFPRGSQGIQRDASIDLGNSSNRFKDIYLSGGIKGSTLTFSGNGSSEHARIDSSGNLLVGTTSTSSSIVGAKVLPTGRLTLVTANSGTQYPVTFGRETTGQVGSITTTASATSYNTSSDERLKENIQDADDAGSKIDAIQIRQFDWKSDGAHQDYGVIAQELLEVAPEAVTEGETEDDMMSVDYSKLVPTLIKEIQTLRNRVAQLENN